MILDLDFSSGTGLELKWTTVFRPDLYLQKVTCKHLCLIVSQYDKNLTIWSMVILLNSFSSNNFAHFVTEGWINFLLKPTLNIKTQYAFTENQNQVTRTNLFIIQKFLLLWIRIEVCVFISDPVGLTAPEILSKVMSWRKLARNIKNFFQIRRTSETVLLQTAEVAKCDNCTEFRGEAASKSQTIKPQQNVCFPEK